MIKAVRKMKAVLAFWARDLILWVSCFFIEFLLCHGSIFCLGFHQRKFRFFCVLSWFIFERLVLDAKTGASANFLNYANGQT